VSQKFKREYELGNLLGEGGMGTVYEARSLRTGGVVAIKFLHAQLSEDSQLNQRFANEAAICTRLCHENIVAILDMGLDASPPYIVLELIQGNSLREHLKQPGHNTLKLGLGYLAQITHGLAHAHQIGVVHRDLKPENILINLHGAAKLADFGLARMSEISQVQTKTGLVLGTPAYISPEQILGKTATAASDIYALGCIIYETISGAPPFGNANPIDTLGHHLKTQAQPLTFKGKQIPMPLLAMVTRCMEKSPDLRPKKTSDIAQILERVVKDDEWMTSKVSKSPSSTHTKVAVKTVPCKRKTGTNKRKTVVITAETPAASASSLQKTLLCCFAALLCLYAIVRWQTPDPIIVTDLNIAESGATTVFLKWRSSRRPTTVTAHIEGANGLTSAGSIQLLSTVAATDGMYDVRGLLPGLTEDSTYSIALEKPDGSKTMARSVSTRSSATFEPKILLSLDENATLRFDVSSKLPFTISDINQNATLDSDYARQHNFSLPAITLETNPLIEYTMLCIDGETTRYSKKVVSHLIEVLSRVYESFAKERAQGKSLLLAEFIDNIRTRKDWKDISTFLEIKTDWFGNLQRLLPGLSRLLQTSAANEKLRQAVTLALVPLQNISGTATRFGVPDKGPWAPTLAIGAHPYRRSASNEAIPFCSIEAKTIGHYTFPIIISDAEGAKAGRERHQIINDAMTRVHLWLDVPATALARAKKAQLVLAAKSCLVDVIVIALFDKTKQVITFWDDSFEDHKAFVDWRLDSLTDFELSDCISDRRNISEPKVGKWRFDECPISRTLVSEVPLSALRPGALTVRFSIFSDQASIVDIFVCAEIRLELYD